MHPTLDSGQLRTRGPGVARAWAANQRLNRQVGSETHLPVGNPLSKQDI
jgi:hypothetical protein